MSETENNFFNFLNPQGGIPRNLAEGMKTDIFFGENVMVSVVNVDANKAGSLHAHPEEQWGVMLKGSGVRTQDGVDHEVSVGDFWRTPGNIEHTFIAGPEGALILDIFSPPREAYRDSTTEGFGS